MLKDKNKSKQSVKVISDNFRKMSILSLFFSAALTFCLIPNESSSRSDVIGEGTSTTLREGEGRFRSRVRDRYNPAAGGRFQSNGYSSRPSLMKRKSDPFGAYVWSGLVDLPIWSLRSTVEMLHRSGVRQTRILLSPRSYATYFAGQEDRCRNSTETYLKCLVSQPEFENAFGSLGQKTLFFTTYDSVASQGGYGSGYLDRSFLESHKEAIVNEYAELTAHLLTKYYRSEVTVILGNWEGDNQVYCGSTYGYLVDSSFKASCDQSYERGTYGSSRSVQDGLNSLLYWAELRQEGIEKGYSLFASYFPRVTTRSHVYQVLEVNNVLLMKEAGYKDLLHSDQQILSKFDGLSFSSWEINHEVVQNPDRARAIWQELEQLAAGKPIIIGEYGFDSQSENAGENLRRATSYWNEKFKEGSIHSAWIWEGVNSATGPSRYGLFNRQGDPQLYQDFLRGLQ
ncbi:MAG: hypothetical protein COT74_13805 [Bdellovibrionales bacterium CG10_big_fil_rev_8_21_14_0_10_45_34]|nr:MAG: hypothetical protein COT74_13805 [Bdellovibrionales bacterium CG10_big_fil_rev_8_21_14_0_10_45_34]